MALEVIWDAIARQAALVNGILAAYGNAAGGQGSSVLPYPEAIQDGPVAVVDYLGSEVVHGSFETLTHQFACVIWVPRGNGAREAAVMAIAPMFERFHLAFDQNVGLFGVLGGAGECVVTGSGPIDDADLEGTPFVIQALLIQATESVSLTHSIGPSS